MASSCATHPRREGGWRPWATGCRVARHPRAHKMTHAARKALATTPWTTTQDGLDDGRERWRCRARNRCPYCQPVGCVMMDLLAVASFGFHDRGRSRGHA